jgi:tetratricopeptide (TPR) repeat protein
MGREFTFEEIEEYLSGTLSSETTLLIEEEMRSNPSFAAIVEKHRNAHILVKNYTIGQLKNKVKRIQEETKARTTSSVPWMRIAASLLIFLVVGGYFFIRSEYRNDQLFSDSFSAYPNQFSVMGADEKNVFAEALRHYDNHEYEEAIAGFSKMPNENEYAVPAQLYMGISFLALNQSEASIKTLEKLTEMETTYSDAARWYLALAYLKSNNEDKAIGLLEDIVQMKGFQSQQAEQLLQKLKSPLRKLPGV